MTTLVAGGASNVGTQVAQYLHRDGREVIFGSRSGKRIPKGFTYVSLDWNDPSTFHNPFPSNHGINAVYLVSPIDDLGSSQKMIPFIQIALDAGVRMFVYLSATIADSKHDSGGLGKIPKFFEELFARGEYQDLDYVTLRPTWFTDNLISEWQEDISKNNQITTCVPTGKIPFVASSEIAKVGYDAIVHGSKHFKRRDPLIIGPQLLSYNEVATILSDVLGRTITHNVVTEEEMLEFYKRIYGDDGSSPESAAFLEWSVDLDRSLERGTQEGLGKVLGTIIGTIRMADWVRERRTAFE